MPTMAGTSVAAARVTGVASLVWAANPDLNFKQVIQILKSTATDLKTPGWDTETGFGLLDSAAAVELAKKTVGENYTPEAWIAPSIWDGEGKVTPTERAAEGGISIAAAPQFSPTFSDSDKVDSITPEKYYQFTVNQPGYVRWTLTRTNDSNEFPGATLVKADGTPGRFKFVSGAQAVLTGTVGGQTPPISRTDGVFVDPGTYYLKLQNGITNTVKNYNLSNQFIPDSVSTFQTPVSYSTIPYFDFSPDMQTKAFNGSSATELNVSGQVEYESGNLSKRIAKYGLEVKETGKLNFNVLSPNGTVEVKVEKFIGSEDTTSDLVNYSFTGNSDYPAEITLNKGRYQIEVKANGDEVILGQILQLPYTLTGVFSQLAPKPGEGNVPIAAGNFIKTVTSNGVDTHYYTNGHLSVQPKGYSTWYASGTGTAIPLLGGTITPIEDTVKKYSFEYYYGNGTFLNGQYSGGGDYYKGYVYALDGTYFKNQIITQPTFNSSGNKGFYKITDASISGSLSDVGKVHITSYRDGDTSKGVFQPAYNVNSALSKQGLGTEYDYIGTLFFNKNIELDLTDPDGNQSMSTSEYLPLNQRISGKSIGGGFDRADYYRFSLTQISDVKIFLDGMNPKAGFEVIKDINNNFQVDLGETLNISTASITPQSLVTTFAPGNYYIRVFPDNPNDLNGKTNYNLAVYANPEIAGNNLEQAFNVGILNRYDYRKYQGFLRTNQDIDDYYRFQLDRRSNVSLTLDGLNTTQLGSAIVEGVTPNTLIQIIRDTNNNGQVDAGEVLQSQSGNPTTTGSINTSLEAGNYFVRVTPEGSNLVNTSYNLTMSAQASPIPINHWNASFINRNSNNVADFNSYDFSNPAAILDLGSQSSGDGKIRLYKDFGLNSPDPNVQSDNFAMEASTITRLEAGKLYKVTTKSDDGTQFFLTKVGRVESKLNLEYFGGWSSGDWRDRGSAEDAKTIYFKVPESGEYVFHIQYYEKGSDAKVDVTLEENKSFVESTKGSEWYAGFYWWDKNQGEPPLKLYENPENEIGIVNLGSNVRDDGKNGIKFDWRDGIPKNDSRLPGDLFAIRAYTQANFEAGKEYRAFVKGDDGFQLFAKNAETNEWKYFTEDGKWEQNYGDLKEIKFKVDKTGLYDLHFQFYENRGVANFDFSWEEVQPQGDRLNDLSNKSSFLTIDEIIEYRQLVAQRPESERTQWYRKLQDKTPYFNQRNNQSPGVSGDVMCNLTALANCLTYLGISNPDPNMQFEDYLEKYRVARNYGSREHWITLAKIAKDFGANPIDNSGYGTTAPYYFDAEKIKAALDRGAAVLASVTANGLGHIVRYQGYNDSGLIVDDPYGKATDGGSGYKTKNTLFGDGEDQPGSNNLWPWYNTPEIQKSFFLIIEQGSI